MSLFEYWYWRIAFSLLLLLMMCCSKACNSSIITNAQAQVEVHGCIERERKALLEFKAGVIDEHGGMVSSWGNTTTTTGGEDDDCCHWRGVECDGHTGHVITLHLSDQGLGGKIDASSLAQLQHLKHLNLRSNDFGGSIPAQLGNLSNLQSIDLSLNYFEGSIPAQLGNLSNLQSLDLSENDFEGSIPAQLGNLSNLQSLDLSRNRIMRCGRLDWLSSLPLLKYLDLSEVNLSSAIHWLEAIYKLPNSLSELHLSYAQLPTISHTMSSNSSSATYSLKVLDLSFNDLNGSFPNAVIGNHTSLLAYLDLSWNQLQGEIPKSLGNLCNLQRLDLSHNKLNGLLEKDFLACSNHTLERIDLSFNQFRGTSFPHLKGFSRLKELYLGFNQLNGTFPQSSIAQLPLLEVLYLPSNSLQGIVSATPLFGLSQMTHLDLSFNSLTFNISLDQLPQFQAEYIRLHSCKLGPRFPNWLQNQRSLVLLDISASGISDALPNWLLYNLSSILSWLNISNNHISGSLPDIQSTSTFGLDMSSNRLGGSIPHSLFKASQYLDLSKNMFSGSISSLSCETTNQSPDQALSHLDLSNNRLSGELPKCWGLWKDLIILNLANNNFSGEITDYIGLLEKIQTLHLSNNSFSGALPSSLKNCRDLSLIDLGQNKLSGRIPVWIGRLSNLIVLNLRSNQFNGKIPLSLCRLKNLQIFDLSSNILSGTIPECLDNIIAMARNGSSDTSITEYSHIYFWDSTSIFSSYYTDYTMVKWKGKDVEYRKTLGFVKSIDFSNNKLIGEIPAQVTDLVDLVALNLSRNHLSGPIPSMIGRLKSLDFLDLSHNRLNGGIPTSLAQIDRLSVLDLSNNKLSGKIPSSTQLQSFNASTYEENLGLCGPPLPEMCPEDEDKPREESPFTGVHGSKGDEIEDVLFYGNIVFGFIIGFWGVCGSLLLNRSWRMAYFQFLIKMKDRLYVATTIHVINRLPRTFQSQLNLNI